jgi:hypothetical protein
MFLNEFLPPLGMLLGFESPFSDDTQRTVSTIASGTSGFGALAAVTVGIAIAGGHRFLTRRAAARVSTRFLGVGLMWAIFWGLTAAGAAGIAIVFADGLDGGDVARGAVLGAVTGTVMGWGSAYLRYEAWVNGRGLTPDHTPPTAGHREHPAPTEGPSASLDPFRPHD